MSTPENPPAFPPKVEEFIKAVAEYITTESAIKSINLSLRKPDAKAWARAYQASGCRGWENAEQAEEAIRDLLSSAARNRAGEEGR